MALVYSKMLELGTILPSFDLPDVVSGQNFNSDSLSTSKGKVIMFICNHCPYVIHSQKQILEISNKYLPKLEFVAISSNDVEQYPADGPKQMKDLALELKFEFPYLYDETQEVAKKYQAECTPEFYLFDQNNRLIYRGRIDESSPGNEKEANGKDLRNAIDDFLAGRKISEKQHPSIGCNIKWK